MNDLFQQINNFYDNGFYYPNKFLVVVGICSLLGLVALFSLWRVTVKLLREYLTMRQNLRQTGIRSSNTLHAYFKKYSCRLVKAFTHISFWYSETRKPINKVYAVIVERTQRASLSLFVILLLFVVLTRVDMTYTDISRAAIAPESLFALPQVGVDLYLAVIKPALNMMHGENFYYYTANYGPSFTLAIIPPMMAAQALGLCSLPCSSVLYTGMITLSIVGYLCLIVYLFINDVTSRNILTLFFISFLLGIPGSLGLERGNIDIIHPVLFGLILLLLHYEANRIGKYQSIIRSIVIGFLAAFITNSKLFFLPMALVAIVGSPYIITATVSAIIWFVLFSYIPNVFGAASSVIDPFKVALVFDKSITFVGHGSIEYNHSFAATASLFTDCIWKQTCSAHAEDVRVITSVSRLLFMIVFILPFLTTKIIRQFIENVLRRTLLGKIRASEILQSFRWTSGQFIQKRFTYEYIVFFFIVATALANLVLRFSFSYRLYYSLPLVFVLWKITEGRKQARWYLLLSMMFLLIKGVWVFTILNPYGMNPFEPRGMNVFVLLHFYYLIKTGLALLTKWPLSFAKHKNQRGNV